MVNTVDSIMQGNNCIMTTLVNMNKHLKQMDVSVLNHNTLIQQSCIVTIHFESKTIAMIDDQPQCTTLLQK